MAASTALEALTAELLGDVGKLHDDVKQLSIALPGASEMIIKAGQQSSYDLKKAVQEAVDALAKDAAQAEAAKLQATFTQVAEKVLQDIRKQSNAAAPSAWKIKIALSMSLVLAISCAAGVILGSWYTKNSYEKQISAGSDLLQIWPQIDTSTKEKIVKLIEKSKQ